MVRFNYTAPDIIEDVKNRSAIYQERPWDLTCGTDVYGKQVLVLTTRAKSRLIKYASKGYRIKLSPRSIFNIDDLVADMNRVIHTYEKHHLKSGRVEQVPVDDLTGYYTFHVSPKYAKLGETVSFIHSYCVHNNTLLTDHVVRLVKEIQNYVSAEDFNIVRLKKSDRKKPVMYDVEVEGVFGVEFR